MELASGNSALELLPSEEEQEWYYLGLPSRPKLVARSSAFMKWVKRREDEHDVSKHITTVGRNHAITTLYNTTSLSSDILTLVRNSLPGWTCIDVMRIGDEDERPLPVILWVGVHPGSTSPNLGLQLAFDCRSILHHYGLQDVHCEVRETVVTLNASPAPIVRTVELDDIALGGSRFLGFTDNIGQSVAMEENPAVEATLTCFVVLRKKTSDPKETYALISRHLAFPRDDLTDYKYTTSGPKMHVIMPGDTTLDEAKESLNGIRRYLANRASQVTIPPERRALAAQSLAKTDKFYQHLLSLTNPESRRIGYIDYSPPRLPQDRNGGLTNILDYSIVKLDQGRFKARLDDLVNLVHVANMDLLTLNRKLFIMDHYVPPPFNEQLRLQGVVPVTELTDPASEYARDDIATGGKVVRVGKPDRSDGFIRWGQWNEMKSFTRHDVNGQDVPSVHFPVVGLQNNFSAEGDSGSAVFAPDGKLVSMLDSGCSTPGRPGNDVAYTTPFEWILQDITNRGYATAYFP